MSTARYIKAPTTDELDYNYSKINFDYTIE